jgi:hypothetical protein
VKLLELFDRVKKKGETVGDDEIAEALRPALRLALAKDGVPDQDREIMLPAERLRLGAAMKGRRDEFGARRQDLEAKREALEARRVVITAEIDAACSAIADYDMGAGQENRQFFEDTRRRLWEQRPAMVDELVARCQRELLSLTPQLYEVPLRAFSGFELSSDYLHPGRRTVDNERSTQARQKGLRELAEAVQAWTLKGEFGTESELLERFDAAYRAIPPRDSIRVVLQKASGPFARFADTMPGPDLPPAA